MHEEQSLTAVGDIPGTLAYISPERLRGEAAGPAADVWAVGVLLWEALAGVPSVLGRNADRHGEGDRAGRTVACREQRPDLARPIVACVDRALSVATRDAVRPPQRSRGGLAERFERRPVRKTQQPAAVRRLRCAR